MYIFDFLIATKVSIPNYLNFVKLAVSLDDWLSIPKIVWFMIDWILVFFFTNFVKLLALPLISLYWLFRMEFNLSKPSLNSSVELFRLSISLDILYKICWTLSVSLFLNSAKSFFNPCILNITKVSKFCKKVNCMYYYLGRHIQSWTRVVLQVC